MASAGVADRKLRLLAMHGYLQNADMFRARIGSWRKGLKSRVELVFLDAPYEVEHPNAHELEESDAATTAGSHRSWWQWTDLEPDSQRPSKAAHYSGWEASQAAIDRALEQHAPVDGLLGFSQGATAAALFLACSASAGTPRGPRGELRLAVLAAGFLPRDTEYAATLRDGKPSLPTLFVYGTSDELVPLDRTLGLREAFSPGAASVYSHPGGHMVPTCSGAFKQQLLAFIDDAVAEGNQAGDEPAVAAAEARSERAAEAECAANV